MISVYFITILLCPVAWTYIIRSGFCKENVRGMTQFDKDRYLGAWYEYANTFEIYEIGGKCVRATYTDEGDVIGVFNEQVNTITGNYGNVKGSARFANPDDPNERGELIVGFGGFGRKKRSPSPQVSFVPFYWQPRQPVLNSPQFLTRSMIPHNIVSTSVNTNPSARFLLPSNDPNYSVISSDYDSYSVVYTCIPLPGRIKKESLWLLTREQYPDQATVDKAIEIMKVYDLPYTNIPLTDHEDCDLLPPVGDGEPANTIESLGK